jgi:hypothetical protein
MASLQAHPLDSITKKICRKMGEHKENLVHQNKNKISNETHTFLETNWGANTSRKPGP